MHLFWSCSAVRGIWGLVNKNLKIIFGISRLTAHMILLGTVRNHSEDFCFAWQLCRAVCTEMLWGERNKVIFNRELAVFSEQQVDFCMFRTAKL
eukprot:c47473_g1_i1 orf=183-464(+)